MLILNGETTGQRAERKGGSILTRTPNWVLSELQRARAWRYQLGLVDELLTDFERVQGLERDRSPEVLRAASLLLGTALPLTDGYSSVTPLATIQSRTCQIWVRCDLEPTMHQQLLNLNPAPTLIIRGTLTQRFSIRTTVAAIGSGALGSTTLNIWLNWFPGSVAPPDIAGFLTTATSTQLLNTDIWLSCGVGPYDPADEWVSVIGSLGNQGLAAADFVNTNISTSFNYQSVNPALRGYRASMGSLAANALRFVSQYVPPDPAVTPALVIWQQNPFAFVNTGRFWGTGTVNQFCVRQANPTPTCAQAGAVAINTNVLATIGVWQGCEAFFSGAASRLKIGANASLVGATCASGVPNSGYTLGARADTGTLASSIDAAEFTVYEGGDATNAELERDRSRRRLWFGTPN